MHVAYGVHAVLGMDFLNILLERALYEPAFRQALPRQDGSAAAKFALTTRAGQLGQRLAELTRDPRVLQVLEEFIAGYRFQRGGVDVLAARGLAGAAPEATSEGAPSFRVLAEGAKPVRRGAEWVLKTAAGVLPLAPPEAEAATWLLARPDVTEAELRQSHPRVDAATLLERLRAAGLLLAT
jgi:hypothetical protein